MDKFEYKVRAEEIKTLIADGDYTEAAAIADTIDWRRVKSVMMLCTVSDVYKINRRYEESKEILLLAYERHPGGRLIVYSLCELCLKLGEFVQAIEYYKEFVQVAPKDNGRYILQYKIYEAQDVSLEERIAVLEELKRRDYREKWAYELAYLYHRVGLSTKCVEECDEIFVWFGEGRYVTKALELKQLHAPLTEEQMVKLDKAKQNIGYSEMDNFQEEFANSADGEEASETSYADYGETAEEMLMEEEAGEGQIEDFDTREYNPEGEQEVFSEPDEMDISIKPVDVSQYNTINLQQELAESMKEILLDVPEPESQVLPEPNHAAEIRRVNETEVYFGDTADMGVQEETVQNPSRETVQEVVQEAAESNKPSFSNTGIIKTFIKPSGYDDILTQEYDGQIGLVMPEEEKIEKQITGQLRIEDILVEWEKQKKEIELKRMEEVRNKVRKQTDTLFADFDEATKSGLLEKLEKAMVAAVIKEEESRRTSPSIIKVADIGDESKLSEKDKMPEADLPSPEPEDEEVQRLLAKEDVVPEEEDETQADIENETQAEIQAETAMFETGSWEAVEEAEEMNEDSAIKETAVEKRSSATAEDAPVAAEAQGPADRELSDSEKEVFGRFVHHKRTKRQLIEVLDNISMAAYTGNVIITGEEGTGAIQVAKGLIKEVQQSDSNFSGKVAKISADTLNKKDVALTFSKLENGAIIIERASRLKAETVKKLLKVLEQENTGYIVILEDIKPAMNKLVEANAELDKAFNLRIDLEALDDQSLVAFAKKYAEELEYAIDDFGVLALHTRIADMQTSDHEVTVAEVQELVEEAIYYADKKNPKHFFDILVGKRYDEEDMIILRERDFMHY